jgi:hypothetical protein
MNLNPTPLEILILLVVSLSIYTWMRANSIGNDTVGEPAK